MLDRTRQRPFSIVQTKRWWRQKTAASDRPNSIQQDLRKTKQFFKTYSECFQLASVLPKFLRKIQLTRPGFEGIAELQLTFLRILCRLRCTMAQDVHLLVRGGLSRLFLALPSSSQELTSFLFHQRRTLRGVELISLGTCQLNYLQYHTIRILLFQRGSIKHCLMSRVQNR